MIANVRARAKKIYTGNFLLKCFALSICRNELKSEKSLKDISQEIQAIIRQITASVTFLPLLSEPCCFDLLVYADKEATVPVQWEDSDPCFIPNSERVKLRSFSTKVSEMFVSSFYLALSAS